MKASESSSSSTTAAEPFDFDFADFDFDLVFLNTITLQHEPIAMKNGRSPIFTFADVLMSNECRLAIEFLLSTFLAFERFQSLVNSAMTSE